MTINKAQEQTLGVPGADFGVDCFSHGPIYVTLSRVSDAKFLFMHGPEKSNTIVVYR